MENFIASITPHFRHLKWLFLLAPLLMLVSCEKEISTPSDLPVSSAITSISDRDDAFEAAVTDVRNWENWVVEKMEPFSRSRAGITSLETGNYSHPDVLLAVNQAGYASFNDFNTAFAAKLESAQRHLRSGILSQNDIQQILAANPTTLDGSELQAASGTSPASLPCTAQFANDLGEALTYTGLAAASGPWSSVVTAVAGTAWAYYNFKTCLSNTYPQGGN